LFGDGIGVSTAQINACLLKHIIDESGAIEPSSSNIRFRPSAAPYISGLSNILFAKIGGNYAYILCCFYSIV
jgi:hypothetical protein